MLTLPGYQILEEIHVGISTVVYRGYRQQDNQPVILKLPREEYPTLGAIARLKHQYEITKNLNIAGIVKPYGLDTYQNRPVLILEDFGGEALSTISSKELDLITFLKIAIQLSTILGELHQHHIIHKDIKPQNILINQSTGQVKIIDFGIASLLSSENQLISNPTLLEGTLAYISPEQTGRMNRLIDYRTDFYSLGATFYELLTGSVPFNCTDPMELVHCHIAKTPIPPKQLVSEIPLAVSDLIMKLLAKTAEERYQSAAGLTIDLEICLSQLLSSGQISLFTPGLADKSSQLLVPQKLYGREAEVATLINAFDRVSQGKTEMILIAGYSGIGKSALVHEIHKPIVRQRGYFISGKFDQFKRNIPYASLIQAFQELMRQLLTESEQQVQAWKQKLLDALGANGQVIIDVIPEVELIIGEQPLVPTLGCAESQNRFNLVFQKFISVFTKKEHPLVLFLDDLQWTDSASLKLITLLMSNPDSQYLLMIGAYRDNEVGAAHPLISTLEEIRKTEATISTITLQPLDIDKVNQLIADTLNSSLERTKPLAQLVHNKTAGNPFFLTQLLKSLYSENLLAYDINRTYWQWDIEQIQEMEITDNVVELMVGEIHKLPEATQNVLKLAACIGNQFDLGILAIVNEKSLSVTASNLWEALQTGLILPLSNAYKFPQLLELNELVVDYKFLHDRVQQAAYSLIPAEQKKDVHLKVGRLLLNNTEPEGLEEKIFAIVNQLNIGTDLIQLQPEKDQLAQLNLIAGNKAKAATAYEPAIRYLTVGLKLLPIDCWLRQYDLTLSLYEAAIEAEYLNTNYQQAKVLIDVALERAQTLLDKVKIYEKKIQFYVVKSDMQAAINTALEILEMLEVPLPTDLEEIERLSVALRADLMFESHQIAELVSLPVMTNPDKLAAMKILISIIGPVYFSKPVLLLPVILTMVSLSVKYGNSSPVTYGYCLYGLLLCGVFVDIAAGYEFGRLALNVLEQFDAKELKCRVTKVFGSHIQPWKEPFRAAVESLQKAIQSGLETGDIEYVGYGSAEYCIYLFFTGEKLEAVEQKYVQYVELVEKLKQDVAIYYIKIGRQLLLNLYGKTEAPYRLVGESFNEETMLPVIIEANYKMLIFCVYLAKLILCCLFKDYAAAIANAELATTQLEGVVGIIYVAQHNFYYSLALLAHYPKIEASEREQVLSKVQANQEAMQNWAFHARCNFQHKYDLVAAEKARVLGQYWEAMDYYERAIQGAREFGYIQEQALASERAAEFYLEHSKEKIAKTYLRDAYYSYSQWGAVAKVKDLESRYPQFLSRTSATDKTEPLTFKTTASTTGGNASSLLDLITVIKASQALASEIVLGKLLNKLIRIVMENAGAQKGFLILDQSGQLVIEASGGVEHSEVTVLQSLPVETSQDLPIAVINYVRRTQSDVVLNDAYRQGIFTTDAYIASQQPKSVLCTPLIHQGKLIGILYLENNSTQSAFTPERLEVLKLLSSQAAVSLENARLYANLKDRTVELSKANSRLKQEILEHKQTESSLRQSEKQFRQLAENIDEVFWLIDADSQELLYVSPAYEQVWGLPCEDLYAHRSNLYEFIASTIHPDDRDRIIKAHEQQLQGEYDEEYRIIQPNGTVRWVRSRSFPIRNESGEIYRLAGITQDIHERKLVEEQLRHDAFYDSLTGLHNRTWFMNRLGQAVTQAKQHSDYQFAVLFLDIDRFKIINDSLGHLAGDKLLIRIARLLADCLNSNELVARLGGDEFAVLVENLLDITQVYSLAQRLQQYLRTPIQIQNHEVFTTTSIGIALSKLGYEHPEEMLRDADIALYKAKQRGGDGYTLFNRALHQQAVARLQVENDLRRALEQLELQLHYQPIVALATGQIVGFEALVRWYHPRRGLVSPAEFIPIAEETGLIIPLGRWVLREACRQLRLWQMQFAQNPPLSMSVNLSCKQLLEPNLVEQIQNVLIQTDCNPRSLKLEITESTLMEGAVAAVNLLTQLQTLGIGLCIDDFGTGYSSLSRLHELPINTLKIDRAFVKRMGADSQESEIVRTILSLAHHLEMDVVAEGVEHKEQLNQLRELQCEYAQGYLFAKPLDHQAAEDLLAAGSRSHFLHQA